MAWLLDTNILIAVSKKRPGLRSRLAALSAGDILLSSVVLAEIEYGIASGERREHNRAVYDALLKAFAMVDFDAAAARHYGAIRLDLERRGEIIGPNDLMIAAHARSLNAVLVTDNTGEFARVGGLDLENWLQA